MADNKYNIRLIIAVGTILVAIGVGWGFFKGNVEANTGRSKDNAEQISVIRDNVVRIDTTVTIIRQDQIEIKKDIKEMLKLQRIVNGTSN